MEKNREGPQFRAVCPCQSTRPSFTLFRRWGLFQTDKQGRDCQWKRTKSKARRGSVFNNVVHLIQHKLQHIWALDCQIDMKLIKFPQGNESNERCEERSITLPERKKNHTTGKLCPGEIWQLEQTFLADGNNKQHA